MVFFLVFYSFHSNCINFIFVQFFVRIHVPIENFYLFWISKSRRRRRRILVPTLWIRFRIFTDKIDLWRHNAREKYRKWDTMSLFLVFPLLIWFYKTHRSTRNPVLQVEEWWWQNTAVNSLQWEKDSLYVVYNFNAAYSESRECDRWWWRGRAACISYAVLAHFSHENLYILSVHTWTGYWTATELWFAVRWRALDFISISFSRSSVPHYTAHVHTLCPLFITYVLLQHTYAHAI